MPMMQAEMPPGAMREHIEEMMRPMMQEMMREMMGQMPGEGGPDPASSAELEGHHATEGDAPAGSPATEAYQAANLAMHAAMDIEFSDDADIDFARGMIGHHQGAIDMARIVLEHGEDPELRQLAEEIIEAAGNERAALSVGCVYWRKTKADPMPEIFSCSRATPRSSSSPG
jgi:uncharacterized protein (DUF305 family)